MTCLMEFSWVLREIAPVLEVNGEKLHRSVAICRSLAKEFKLARDSEWDAVQIDVIIDTSGDLRASTHVKHAILNGTLYFVKYFRT